MLWKISYRTTMLILITATVLVVSMGALALWAYSYIPSAKEIRGCMTTKLYHVHLCPGSSSYTRLNQISVYLQKAVVLSEDSTFWTNQGFDFQEMQNSFKQNLEEKKFARGGSTITQQLAKNLFLTKEKTLQRKLLEALITVRINKTLTKKEILERYLNVVQFGKNIYGVKQAADFYFKKSPEDLDLVESAFLTMLLPNPEIYSKSFYKKTLTPFAQKRIHEIIERLYRYDRVSESEYETAQGELAYFLTGEEPPELAPEDLQNLDQINEEDFPEVEE
jgi:monofunctional biosynthetic peptidoglycan transglycosylase